MVDYISFKPGPVAADVFEAPKLCSGMQLDSSSRRSLGFALRMGMLLPAVATGEHTNATAVGNLLLVSRVAFSQVQLGIVSLPGAHSLMMSTMSGSHAGDDEEYNNFAAQHSRKHSSLWEYELRRQTFQSNKQFINEHNAKPDASYKLALNRFGDWSHEEFLAVMLPTHGRPKPRRAAKALHDPVIPAGKAVPSECLVSAGGAVGHAHPLALRRGRSQCAPVLANHWHDRLDNGGLLQGGYLPR